LEQEARVEGRVALGDDIEKTLAAGLGEAPCRIENADRGERVGRRGSGQASCVAISEGERGLEPRRYIGRPARPRAGDRDQLLEAPLGEPEAIGEEGCL